MYVIRNGPIHDQAGTLPRGKLPRPIFICCGSIGVVLTILGGIILGVGQQKLRQHKEYSESLKTTLPPGVTDINVVPTLPSAEVDAFRHRYILVGSIVLGFGLILTILAVFLSISWATLGSNEYESTHRRISVSCPPIDIDGVELDGYREMSPK